MSTVQTKTPVARDLTPLAAGLDTAIVVLFVSIGRRTHDQDPGVAGLVETAAPFLIGLAITWVAVRAWNRPAAVTTGGQIWAGTVVIGMALRRLVFDDGIALAFVLVAAAFLGVFLVGWRIVALLVERRRTAST